MRNKNIKDAYAVFSEVFNTDMTYEMFFHKHVDNPNMVEQISTLVNYQGDTPAGTNSFMGDILLLGDKTLSAVQSCDTAVKDNFRGKHIFLNLIQEAIEYCQNNGIDMMYGFPNHNSYPGFIKLGFHDVGEFSSYVVITRPFQFLTAQIMFSKLRAICHETVSRQEGRFVADVARLPVYG